MPRVAKKQKQPLGVADANVAAGPSIDAKVQGEKPISNHMVGNENTVPVGRVSKSKKRKSTESTADSVDASGPTTSTAPEAPVAKKPRTTKPKPDPLDVSGVELDGEDAHDVPVYDSCDTIRRKIRAHLRKDGITQAAFMRAIAAAAFRDNRKVQGGSFSNFMGLKGPLAGNTNRVYYASYVFFEKLRIKQGKPKTNDRFVMEDVHPRGVDLTQVSGNIRYIVPVGQNVGIDKYGRVGRCW